MHITKYIFQYTLHHQRSILCLIPSFWSLMHVPSFRPHHSGVRCHGHQHPGPWCGSTALLHREQVGRHHVASFWEPLRCRWAPGPTAHPSVTRYGSVTLYKKQPFYRHLPHMLYCVSDRSINSPPAEEKVANDPRDWPEKSACISDFNELTKKVRLVWEIHNQTLIRTKEQTLVCLQT